MCSRRFGSYLASHQGRRPDQNKHCSEWLTPLLHYIRPLLPFDWRGVTDDVRIIHFVLPVTAGQANASEAPHFNLFRDLALSHFQPTGNHRSFAFLAKRRGEMETLHAHVRQCSDVGPSRQANLTL
jgi:hypothetical protein